MYLTICEDSNFLSTILLVKTVIDIIRIGVPIILILMCAIDLGKQVLNTEAKSYQAIIKRAIAAVAIFFIPTILTLFLDMLNAQDYKTTACWTNANTATIATLSARQKEEEEAQIAARQAENEQAQKEREELAATREEIRKANEEKAEEIKKEQESGITSSGTVIEDDTLFNENGKDGMVEVINGVFYKPASGTSGAEGTKGSGPYGYVIFFYNRLKAFVDAAAAAGHSISMSTTDYGAWRPYDKQLYFWNCYQTKSCNNGNLAAKPGTSNHGWGIASDLSYGSGQHGVTQAKYWAHDNASKYGLKFPLCSNIRGSCQEDWHIEPARLEKK